MGGGGWFYVPKVRIPEAFPVAMFCAVLSFGVVRGRRLHGWAMGRTQARGAKPKSAHGTERSLVPALVLVGWLVGRSLSMGTEATICGEAVSWWWMCQLVIVGMAGAAPC